MKVSARLRVAVAPRSSVAFSAHVLFAVNGPVIVRVVSVVPSAVPSSVNVVGVLFVVHFSTTLATLAPISASPGVALPPVNAMALYSKSPICSSSVDTRSSVASKSACSALSSVASAMAAFICAVVLYTLKSTMPRRLSHFVPSHAQFCPSASTFQTSPVTFPVFGNAASVATLPLKR